MFKNLNILLRTVVLGGILAILGWWTLTLRTKFLDSDAELLRSKQQISSMEIELQDGQREVRRVNRELGQSQEQIETLSLDVAEGKRIIKQREEEIDTLELALNLLKVDHRLAKLEVLSQGEGNDGEVRTVLTFTELGPDGAALGEPQEITITGTTVYVETLVVKFLDSYVERGDALRGTSICLFKRIFGDDQRPNDGQAIDNAGEQPLVYGGDNLPAPLHEEIWDRFWDYANDTELANQLGVRAVHGEAPFIEARVGQTYVLELRSSGGLTIRTE